MPNTDTEKVRQNIAEITRLALDDKLGKSLQKIGQEKSLLEKAKTNPKAFLKKHGFTLPAQADAAISIRKASLPRGRTTIIPRFTVTICFHYSYTIGKKTPFEHELNFEVCTTFYIW